MANEISINLSITASKNGAKFTRQESFKDDMTGDAWTTGVVDIDDTGISLAEQDVGTFGWVFVKNLGTDSTLYIDIQHSDNDDDDDAVRIYGGESTIFKTAGRSSLWADSSSGTQALEFAIIEL